jgi:thioredoxin-related protein
MDDAVKVMAEEEPELAAVQFLRVEAEERADVSMEYQVAAVPTFLFFRLGI